MPFILGIIVLFIYIAMFCHDRCAMEYVCQMAVQSAVWSQQDPETAARQYIDDNLPQRLIGSWDTDVSVFTDEDGITAQIEATSGLFGKVFYHSGRANKHFCPKY